MTVTLSFDTEQPAAVVNKCLADFVRASKGDNFDMSNVVLSYIDGRKTFVYRMPCTEDPETRNQWIV